MKRRIKLTESDLHRIVENTVKNIIREYQWDINNNSKGLDTNFYNTHIEGFDNEDDYDEDDYYKPLDGNLSFDNNKDYYNSAEYDDNFDDGDYFEGRKSSNRKSFDNNFERLGNESEYEENNEDDEYYENPQEELDNRLERIKNGESVENVFKVRRKLPKNIYVIEFNKRFNFINANNGNLLSNKWFSDVSYYNYHNMIYGLGPGGGIIKTLDLSKYN